LSSFIFGYHHHHLRLGLENLLPSASQRKCRYPFSSRIDHMLSVHVVCSQSIVVVVILLPDLFGIVIHSFATFLLFILTFWWFGERGREWWVQRNLMKVPEGQELGNTFHFFAMYIFLHACSSDSRVVCSCSCPSLPKQISLPVPRKLPLSLGNSLLRCCSHYTKDKRLTA
jgi:hypothetical protein